MTLDDVKNYLRVDGDITEDDALIADFITAAKSYIEHTTGKEYVDDSVYNLGVKMLVAHWYDHRELSPHSGGVVEYPHSVTAIINHIAFCGAYASANSAGGV
jgi:uncharacterized phage protein (predicted DNA packaging)